jgi:hypothetical protein
LLESDACILKSTAVAAAEHLWGVFKIPTAAVSLAAMQVVWHSMNVQNYVIL